jgi:hypothetical protein
VNVITNVTPAEFRQAIKLNRTWRYWLRLVGANWYATVLLLVILWAIVARVAQGKPVQADSIMILLIPIAFLGFGWARTQRAIERGAQEISDLGGTASLDDDGLHATASSGATSFTPWSIYTGWKEGTEVFTLERAKNFTVLSKRELSEAELDQARLLFEKNIS